MSSCRQQETSCRAEELYRIVRRRRYFAQAPGATPEQAAGADMLRLDAELSIILHCNESLPEPGAAWTPAHLQYAAAERRQQLDQLRGQFPETA